MLAWHSRDEDRYGRKLRVLVRNGRSLGDILVSEGLAWRERGEAEGSRGADIVLAGYSYKPFHKQAVRAPCKKRPLVSVA